jgi:integrase
MIDRSHVPSYRKHKQSGQAIVTLTDGLGGRRDVLLGTFGTAASRRLYAQTIDEWEARGRRLYDEDASDLSVNELALAFLRHAEQHYRRADGTTTHELVDYRYSIRPLRQMYGTLPAADLGPLKLKAVRQKMLDARRHLVRLTVKAGAGETALERWVWEHEFRQQGSIAEVLYKKKWHAAVLLDSKQALSRGVINQRIARVVRMYKWAVAEEIVPETVWRALTAVRGLERGRTEARETESVRPVSDAVVEATLPHVLPTVAAMIELQRLTGMRPGEVCAMRGCDLDTAGEVWLYRPGHHKTRHKGKERVIAIGPKAREIVRRHLTLDAAAPLFSARRAVEELSAERRRNRKSKITPSQGGRRPKRNGKRRPRESYEAHSYARAVANAVAKANTAAACAGCKPLKPEERCQQCQAAAIPHWHPNQLRHTHATKVRRRFGLEAAQVALGHSQLGVTQVYAERDEALAVRVAKEIG